jgi:quinol monooxygenase YgiN
VWRDKRALEEHFAKPYVLQFVADTPRYVEGDMEVQWLVMASEYLPGKP